MSHWRPVRDQEIVNLINKGISPKTVALAVRVSVWTVYRAIKSNPFKCPMCGETISRGTQMPKVAQQTTTKNGVSHVNSP